MSRIFISYRRQDSEAAVGRMFDRLIDRFMPEEVFMDTAKLQAGDEFRARIEDEIRKSSIMLVMIGPRWTKLFHQRNPGDSGNHDDMVRFEIETAIKQGIAIIPVAVDQEGFPRPENLPGILQLVVESSGETRAKWRSFEHDLGELMAAIVELFRKGSEQPRSLCCLQTLQLSDSKAT